MTEQRDVAPFPAPGPRPADLPDLLGRLARRDPDRVAIHERTDDGLVAVTRGELWQRVRALAEELRGRGVSAGDAVAVWMPNWTEALVWQCAVAARGAHVVGINTRYGVEEATHVLARARPVLVALAHGFHGLDLAARLRAAVEGSGVRPQVALVRGDGTTPDVGGLTTWTPERTDGPEPEPSDPDRLAVAFTTSGSTGLPKLAAHTGAAVLTHAVAGAAALGLTEDDVVLGALPLSGVFGYNAVLAGLAAGGAALLEPVFDADATLDDMAAVGVTHLASGDDLVLRLTEAQRARPRELSSWRWWGVADFQGRSQELAAWLADELGVATAGVYGSSELFALAATWPLSEPTPQRWAGGGRVVHPGIEVRVQAGPGVEGELEFRGPNVVDGYLGSSPDVFTDDGWFRSGDLGVVVDEGAFVYVCRAGDALRLRGFLVDPAEIELRLGAHPAVHTAKVVGIEGPDGGSVAVGFVTLDAPASPDDLRDWCAATLAAFKVPAAVHVIDEMPTTSGTNGTKIRAEDLRRSARAGTRTDP
ncbi:AMP-binding protein [Actinomycetospora sp. CA-084318]|uniref:AMP-binding protein n=1 Tax=Actinomycetospora sp. CA-084318 TaxID=3239892 RepID=UPI003D978BAC